MIFMKEIKNKKSGITLVALVITIIILLILAGITISQLTENGLFRNSKSAQEKYDNAQEKESIEISKYTNEIDKYMNVKNVRENENSNTGISKYLTQNYAIEGSLCISKGVASGFTGSSYLILPETFNPGNNSWEILIKFKTDSDINSLAAILEGRGNSDTSYSSLSIYQDSGILYAFLSSIGSDWNISSAQKIIDLTASTTYYLKFKYDGTKYTYLVSSDGTNYEQKLEITSSSAIYSDSKLIIGRHRTNSNQYFKGFFDLKESYIKINNVVWWDCWMGN